VLILKEQKSSQEVFLTRLICEQVRNFAGGQQNLSSAPEQARHLVSLFLPHIIAEEESQQRRALFTSFRIEFQGYHVQWLVERSTCVLTFWQNQFGNQTFLMKKCILENNGYNKQPVNFRISFLLPRKQ
jgi:hypothetical protein